MTTNNHPAHAPLTSRRLHQMRDILSKAAEQRDGGDIGYAMSDAVKLIDEVLASEPVAPEFHTEADRFLPECLKPEEISGEQRNSRIAELMGWFVRFYNGKANPKWFKAHAAELCYYILTAKPVPVVSEPMPVISEVQPLVSEQAMPVVPEELLSEMEEVLHISDRDHEAWHTARNGIAACRSAMLHGKFEPVSEPYKLPVTLIKAMQSAIDQLDRRAGRVWRGYPQHSHSVSGVWDQSNGRIANEPCSVCALWDEMREYLTAAPQQDAAATSSNIDKS